MMSSAGATTTWLRTDKSGPSRRPLASSSTILALETLPVCGLHDTILGRYERATT